MISTRRQIAFFSPLPPERSGIADYSAELLPYLARWVDVTLFAVRPDRVADSLRERFPIRNIAEYGTMRWRYDVALHQMGASMYHDAMYAVLLRYGGIVTLHEHNLHQFIATRTIVAREGFASYEREMGYALGVDGVRMAIEIGQGRREHPFVEVLLTDRLLDRSQGIIFHSRFTQRQALSLRPCLRTTVIPAPIEATSEPLLSRRELGCPEDALIFASGGQVIHSKQLPLALEAFARLREDYPAARYIVVGDELKDDLDLAAWLADRDLGDAVMYAGYCENLRVFRSWLAAADVLVNLRYPTAGETSATALRGLAAGRPVIVSDHGWYAELPDDACVKVPPNDGDALLAAMRRLACDPGLREAIGARAAAYAREEHAPARAAERYAAFIEQVLIDAQAAPQESTHG
jgi:glycosyltransferase involved in cell wall biosynthesis